MYPTSARFRQVMLGSHRAVMRARILPNIQFGANPTGGLEIPIKSGDVKMSSTSDIKATLDCEVPGEYWDSVRPYGSEIFIERGVDYGDGTREYVPLGYFRIQKIDQASAPSGTVKISANDRIAQLKDVRLVYPYNFPAGLTHRELFNRLVNGYTNPTGSATGGPFLISYGMYFSADVPIIFDGYDGDKATLPAGTVEDDVYEFIADTVDTRSCVVLFDRLGQMVITKRDRPPDTPPLYTVGPGKLGNLISASRSLTREGVYNIIVSRGSDPAYVTGYNLAYNDDVNSLLYWRGPFGPVPRYFSSPLIQTFEAAGIAAQSVLARYKGLPSGLATASLPDPSLDPLDPIAVQIGTTLETHVIDEVTIPLVGSNSALQIKTRTLNEVPSEEDFPPPVDPGTDPGGGTDPGTGDPIYAAEFPDGVAFPTFTEPSTNATVNCTPSDYVSKLAALAPGQTLVLADGTYPGSIQTVSKAGTPTQPLVIKAANLGGAKFASGGGLKLTGKYILAKNLTKEFDDSGKTFSVEGAAENCGFEGCVVGPVSLPAPDAAAAKSLHYYAGGDAKMCFFTFCESRNKAKAGNGVLVDGNFTTFKACEHILIDHMDMHDYGTEVVNEFEAIRYGVSTMQTTVVNSVIMRCVFTNIATEPEIISVKATKVASWGHTIQNCVGVLSLRHGDNNYHRDCYSFGPATGSGGTKAGGHRVYGKNNEISYCYWQDLNGSSYESTLSIDGGDTTAADSGHQNVVGGKFTNNLGVNCATAIVIGEHYTTAPSGIAVKDNDFVACGGTAVKTVKAPTGTNNITNNNHYATLAEAGITGPGGGGTTPGGGDPGGGGTPTTPTQSLGVGGVATPSGAILATSDTTSSLTLTSSDSGTSTNPKVYDGKGHKIGRVTFDGCQWVVVQNYYIQSGNQYGVVFDDASNVTLQNCDISNVRVSGDGDLNAITLWGGDNVRIKYNTAVNFTSGDVGDSHTDALQTWVSSSHNTAATNVQLIGNKFVGPSNSSRSNSIPSIHQCIMVEGAGHGGNSGGSGNPSNWFVSENEFGDSWNQSVKLDGASNFTFTRNRWTGSSDKIFDLPSASNTKIYSDNTFGSSYGSIGATVINGSGPANPS